MRGTSVLAAARGPITALAFFSAAGLAWCPGVARSATSHPARTDLTPFAYNTSGVVGIGADPASVVGPAVLQFQGVAGASYDPAYAQPISLGHFVLNPATPTNGLATIYTNTPFEVEIQAPQLDKTSSFPLLGSLFPGLGKSLSLKTVNENSVILKGTLNGVVSASGQVNVTPTVATVKLGSMDAPTSDHITHYTFPIHFSQLKLPPTWLMSGSTLPTGSSLTMTARTSTAPPVAQPQLIGGSSVAPAPLAASGTVAAPTPTPTPEPATVLIFATAFGGLALARRFRVVR